MAKVQDKESIYLYQTHRLPAESYVKNSEWDKATKEFHNILAQVNHALCLKDEQDKGQDEQGGKKVGQQKDIQSSTRENYVKLEDQAYNELTPCISNQGATLRTQLTLLQNVKTSSLFDAKATGPLFSCPSTPITLSTLQNKSQTPWLNSMVKVNPGKGKAPAAATSAKPEQKKSTSSNATTTTKPASSAATSKPAPVSLKPVKKEEPEPSSTGNGPVRKVFYGNTRSRYNSKKEDSPLEDSQDSPGDEEKGAFMTAKDKLIADEKLAGNSAPSAGKNTRSNVRRQGKRKFVPPIKGREEEKEEESAPKKTKTAAKRTDENGEERKPSDNPLVEELLEREELKLMDPILIERICSEILDHSPNVSWDDIAGLEFAKKCVHEAVIMPMQRPDLFVGLRKPARGILLFGPPGTGKTMIGKAIASQSGAKFFNISASSLTSKWIGEGEKTVRALFAVARCLQPAVIFMDEIDSVLTQRSEGDQEATRRLKTEFLVQLDGAGSGPDDKLLVIGATNRPQEIDEAARRRLVKRLYIPLPDAAGRRAMITRLISSLDNSLTPEDIENVVQKCAGYSGSDMHALCAEAAMGPIRSVDTSMLMKIDSKSVRPINIDDFYAAFDHVRASVSQADLVALREWNEIFGSFKGEKFAKHFSTEEPVAEDNNANNDIDGVEEDEGN